MPDPVSNAEIEDVLSSIRRLVSEEPNSAKRKSGPVHAVTDRLVLTPAQRVEETQAAAPPVEERRGRTVAWQPDPDDDPDLSRIADLSGGTEEDDADATAGVLTLEDRVAGLEAALMQSDGEWEPDGSEDENTDLTRPISADADFDMAEAWERDRGDDDAAEAIDDNASDDMPKSEAPETAETGTAPDPETEPREEFPETAGEDAPDDFLGSLDKDDDLSELLADALGGIQPDIRNRKTRTPEPETETAQQPDSAQDKAVEAATVPVTPADRARLRPLPRPMAVDLSSVEQILKDPGLSLVPKAAPAGQGETAQDGASVADVFAKPSAEVQETPEAGAGPDASSAEPAVEIPEARDESAPEADIEKAVAAALSGADAETSDQASAREPAVELAETAETGFPEVADLSPEDDTGDAVSAEADDGPADVPEPADMAEGEAPADAPVAAEAEPAVDSTAVETAEENAEDTAGTDAPGTDGAGEADVADDAPQDPAEEPGDTEEPATDISGDRIAESADDPETAAAPEPEAEDAYRTLAGRMASAAANSANAFSRPERPADPEHADVARAAAPDDAPTPADEPVTATADAMPGSEKAAAEPWEDWGDAAGGDAPSFDLYPGGDSILDEDALRDMVAQIVREELQGALGERITRNVRRLVRREVEKALAIREFE